MGNQSHTANVVFDLDGTLVDSAAGIQHIANILLAQHDREPLSIETTISFIGNGITTFLQRMSQARDLSASLHESLFSEYQLQDKQSNFVNQTYAGVVECLETLRAEKFALGLCTNKLTDASHTMLENLGLSHYFDTVVCGDTLETRKPDPQMLHMAFDALPSGVNIYVGDSEVDAETAQRANTPFMLFTEGYRKTPSKDIPHSHEFSHYDNLYKLIVQQIKAA